MTDDGEGTGREMRMEPLPASEATPDQLAIALVWEISGDAFLRGILTATNVSDAVATVSGKPNIRPLGADGQQTGVPAPDHQGGTVPTVDCDRAR